MSLADDLKKLTASEQLEALRAAEIPPEVLCAALPPGENLHCLMGDFCMEPSSGWRWQGRPRPLACKQHVGGA